MGIKKMNKIFTVISLLFIVAYANCTQKVSYSEIVSSLAQVSHIEGADAIVAAVATSWEESLKKLTLFNIALNNQCTGILQRAIKKEDNIKAAIKANTDTIAYLIGENKEIASHIAEAVEAQAGNKKNAEALKEEIVDDAGKLQDKLLAIVERARVLKRLSNLVQDELTGAQKESTVGDFKVDKKLSGFSFLEVHNQLKELNSHDPIVKSMITTLVLITQDQKDLFANQAQVGKIQAMINGIIKKDAAHGAQIREIASAKAIEINKSLSELADDMFKNMNSIAENKATVAQHVQIIAFLGSEKNGMDAQMKRASVRKVSNVAMCKKVQDLNKVQQGDFKSGVQRFADLKKLVA